MASFTPVRTPARFLAPPFSISIDLKPENVLICIEDVEAIIQNEIASATANGTPPPTKLVGVPPSRGRGGNQTPRPESVFITGSQPLPSPSSSHGASPMLDRWAFGMSKIDGIGATVGGSVSASAAPSGPGSLTSPPSGARESSVDGKTQLHAVEMDRASERIAQLLREPGFGEKKTLHNAHKVVAGPSLLTQQAPHDPNHNGAPRISEDGTEVDSEGSGVVEANATAADSMALDPQSAGGLEAVERITVKIADLGNGERLLARVSQCLHNLTWMEPPGWNTTSPTTSKPGSTVAQKYFSARGGARARIFGAWHAWCVA